MTSERAFKAVAQVIGRWFGASIDPDAMELEIELDQQDRALRILPNPKEQDLILVEIRMSAQETASLLEKPEAQVTLHRVNGDAMASQDWRFCVDADGSALIRASFHAAGIASESAIEQAFLAGNQFVDMLLALMNGSVAPSKSEVPALNDSLRSDAKRFHIMRA